MTTRRPYRCAFAFVLLMGTTSLLAQTYPIVDTGQTLCYDNDHVISAPDQSEPFYGQDAQFDGIQPVYRDNGDGTVTDLNTGLMWQQNLPAGKYVWSDCVAYADTSTLAGHTDWRLPTIKELYSLVLFSGVTGTSESTSIPYLDTNIFGFRIGGEVDPSERFIDSQYATSTLYKGTTMGGNETMFGFNFVDGRIKGYPTFKTFDIKMVRGRTDYGVNAFHDNGDGTVTDQATGLMWDQSGSASGMNWEETLAWVWQKNAENYLGHSDWRLPNAKELQSIIDYARSPDITDSPAIDPLFHCTSITNEAGQNDYPFYWTGTTHCGLSVSQGTEACYVSFGRAMGYMSQFGGWVDVHGAGAQRSDPKTGDSSDYPYGHGPQGDAIRIDNYVRLVRNAESTTVDGEKTSSKRPQDFSLEQNYPNPFNPDTTIRFTLSETTPIRLCLWDIHGRKLKTLAAGTWPAGSHEVVLNAADLASGVYYYGLKTDQKTAIHTCLLMK